VRALRRKERITQADLARRIGISASYLNLIEHNHRTLTGDLLVKLSDAIEVDLKSLSAAHDGRRVTELLEVFGDPLFDNVDLITQDVQELAQSFPGAADAVITLYDAYRRGREASQMLAERLAEGQTGIEQPNPSRLPNEEVNDFVQRHLNYFPALEDGADVIVREAQLTTETLFDALVRYLKERTGDEVRIEPASQMRGSVRVYDPDRKLLLLSEMMGRGRRCFQLAYHVGLRQCGQIIGHLAADPLLTTSESHALCRVALANYLAAAIVMPYQPFLQAAKAERYDIDVLAHRFNASFEQTCHRLATLRRPGAEGIPFHMLRVDIAGNMSKRFSASGLKIPRFSGACARWNVFAAFLTPGMIRTQLSQMPDGQVFFGVGRTVNKESFGFRAPRVLYALSIGCDISYASEMIYADGLNLATREGLVPVGPSCRLCERMDCEQRAYPPLQHPLAIDEHHRGVSFYAAAPPRKGA